MDMQLSPQAKKELAAQGGGKMSLSNNQLIGIGLVILGIILIGVAIMTW